MDKKKKKIVGVILLLIGLGLLISSLGLIPLSLVGSYSSWDVSFDPTLTSNECKNTDPEFGLFSETSYFSGKSIITTQPMKTVCGLSSNGITVINLNSLQSEMFNENLTTYIGPNVLYNISTVGYRTGAQMIGLPFYLCDSSGKIHYAEVNSSNPTGYSGTFTSTKPIVLKPSAYYTICNSGGSSPIQSYTLSRETPKSFEITYTTPRDTIPNELHYRKFSCPLLSGYYLTAQTFKEGQTVSKNSFAINPNYFCARNPVIKTQLVTQRATTSNEEYVKIVNNEVLTVPEGETWTFFYVPTSHFNPSIQCPNGTAYDTGTEKCVKMISGFQYVCSSGTLTYDLSGNPVCSVTADIQVICPTGATQINGQCYVYGDPTMLCPPGTVKYMDKCYFDEGQIYCPEGSTMQSGKCITTEINCPAGTIRVGNKCFLNETVTNVVTDWVCPDGSHKDSEQSCVQDSDNIVCPSGTERIGQSCVANDFVCSKGYYDTVVGKCVIELSDKTLPLIVGVGSVGLGALLLFTKII